MSNEIQTVLKKPFWKSLFEAVQAPYTFLTKWTSKSPLLTALAVVFLVQPIVSMGISAFHVIHPAARPVTYKEFKLLEQRVDTLQVLVVKDAPNSKVKAVVVKRLQQDRKDLDVLSKKLDSKYTKH